MILSNHEAIYGQILSQNVAFERELTKETIYLPMGCFLGGVYFHPLWREWILGKVHRRAPHIVHLLRTNRVRSNAN